MNGHLSVSGCQNPLRGCEEASLGTRGLKTIDFRCFLQTVAYRYCGITIAVSCNCCWYWKERSILFKASDRYWRFLLESNTWFKIIADCQVCARACSPISEDCFSFLLSLKANQRFKLLLLFLCRWELRLRDNAFNELICSYSGTEAKISLIQVLVLSTEGPWKWVFGFEFKPLIAVNVWNFSHIYFFERIYLLDDCVIQ